MKNIKKRIKHFLETGNFTFRNVYSHWTWKIRKTPIIGHVWYEGIGGGTYHRSIKMAIICWWDWDVLPVIKRIIR